MQTERSADVLVLGGGPAGSTAGALLARAGLDTILLEAQPSPRSYFDESLLPHALPILDHLGVHDTVRNLPHTRRTDGVTLVPSGDAQRVTYRFADGLRPTIESGYHVRRPEFDAALLAAARALGVEVLEGWTAATPIWENDHLVGATVRDPEGGKYVVRSRVCLDATGKRSFLASRMGWRFPYTHHRKVAVLSDFQGVALSPVAESATFTVFPTGGGWLWLAPSADGAASVGAVLEAPVPPRTDSPPDRLLADAIQATPELERRLHGATLLRPPVLVRNFSHRVNRMAGHGYCLLGDAAGFLDPLFSTGIFTALATAASAAEDVIDAFGRHRRAEGNDFAPTVALTRSLHRLFFAFIRAFQDPHFQALLLRPRPPFGARPAICSLLAGDILRPGVWRRTARPQLLRAFAKVHHLLPGSGLAAPGFQALEPGNRER